MKRLVGRILDNAVSATPNRLAVTLGDESLTFAEVDRRANQMARALSACGVKRGDRVMTWSGISLHYVELYFAIIRLGATFVPLNPSFGDDEAAAMASYIRPHFLVADDAHLERARQLARPLPIRVVPVGDGGQESADQLIALAARQDGSAIDDRQVDEEDIESIFLTSGSTGIPKGVMISHRATWNRMNMRNRHDYCSGRGELCMFPLFHFAGWAMLLNSWVYRRPVHLVHAADGATILRAAARWQVGVIYAIPAVWERILTCPDAYDLSSVRLALTGTSRVEPDLVARIRRRIPGVRINILYGSTEMGPAIGLHDEDIELKPLSIGLPHPAMEARLDDGELCLRADTAMSGYFDRPEETAAVMADGWYRSGDLAERDEDGFYAITGRRREIIRSGGETIAPAEVESVLRTAPGVADVGVVGVPDAEWGEIVCAAVVPLAQADPPTLDALRQHAAVTLAAFKHPRRLMIVSSLPKTEATGQVQRSLVQEMVCKTLSPEK